MHGRCGRGLPSLCVAVGALIGLFLSGTPFGQSTSGAVPVGASAVAAGCGLLPARNHSPSDPDEAMDEAQVRQQRLLSGLLRSPRFGPVFDRVYAFYAGRGDLDSLIQSLQHQMASGSDLVPDRPGQPFPDRGAAALLLGMVELRRGESQKAVAAFQQSEVLRPGDSFVCSCLARAFEQNGDPAAAAAALQRALSHHPPRRDQLVLTEELARLYQRLNKPDLAVQVWLELEQREPQDQQIRERIAQAMMAAGEYRTALQRYQDLVAAGSDPQQRVRYVLRMADVRQQLGEFDHAVRELRAELQQLRADSWLAAEVRSRIEYLLMLSGDQAAMLQWYRDWIDVHPEDTQTLLRLADLLIQQGESASAIALYESSLKKMPSDLALRQALIDELTRTGQWQAARAQHVELDRQSPHDANRLEQWGWLFLRDSGLPLAERQAQAAAIWQRMQTPQADDPVILRRLGDLFRQAGMTDLACAMYQRCVEVAPQDLACREVLGEYLHELGRTADALQMLESIAADSRSTVTTRIRVAEILSRIGHSAVAEGLLERIDPVSLSDAERQQLETTQIHVLTAAGKLEQRLQELSGELAGDVQVTPARWRTLAGLQRAAARPAEALDSALHAVRLAPDSLESVLLAVTLAEQAGQRPAAVALYRSLVRRNDGSRATALRRIAQLEKELGNCDAAMRAGQELLQAEPDHSEHYAFVAALHFDCGRIQDGKAILERAVLAFPDDRGHLLSLARANARQMQTDEAIALYWRMYASTTSLEDRQRIVTELAELMLRVDRFDELIRRLEAEGRTAGQERSASLCLASAFLAAGQFQKAQELVQGLLSSDLQDVELLHQLVTVNERAGAPMTAAGFQRQLNQRLPSAAGKKRLAMLLRRAGTDLERTGNAAGACDVFLQALHDDPAAFASDFETQLQSFESARRLPELARAVVISGVKHFADVAPQLIHLGALADRQNAADRPGEALVAAVLEAFPDQRLSLVLLARRLSSISDDHLKQSLTVSLIPPADLPGRREWFPWDQTSDMAELAAAANIDPLMHGLSEAIGASWQQNPQWHGGALTGSLLLAKRGERKASLEMVKTLLADTSVRLPDEVAIRASDAFAACPGENNAQQIMLLEACLVQRPARDRPDDDPVVDKLRNAYLRSGLKPARD